MNDKLLFLLEELKENYSDQLLNDTLDCLEDSPVFFEDNERYRLALNGQSDNFYNSLASQFIEDLNEMPLMYFMVWEYIIYFFDESTRFRFFVFCLEIAKNTDAYDFINGFIQLNEGNAELALLYFNRIEDFTVSYFIGLCYLSMDNFENAIINYEQFLKNIDINFGNILIEGNNLLEDPGIIITKWNAYNDLAYLFTNIDDYKSAKVNYEKALEFMDLEETYRIKSEIIDGEEEFSIWVNNYIFILDKLNEDGKCIELLKFTISKMPNELIYQKKLALMETKFKNQDFVDKIFSKVFKTKQPFNIGKFEQTKILVKEKVLEDLIIEQIKYGFKVFGKSLEVYKDEYIYGRQYFITSMTGILDLLLIDKSDNQIYVVELKRNEAGIEVVEQIENYIDGMTEELGCEVKGIICLHKPDPKLSELVRTKPNIELFTYHFDFTKIV